MVVKPPLHRSHYNNVVSSFENGWGKGDKESENHVIKEMWWKSTDAQATKGKTEKGQLLNL